MVSPRRLGWRRTTLSLVTVIVTMAGFFIALGPASAAAIVSPQPDFPTTSTVGQTFTGRLVISNNSTDGERLFLTSITLAPGCSQASPGPDCAGGVDAGVFVLGTVGTGRADDRCALITFTIAETSPGLYTFTPTEQVSPLFLVDLFPGEQCVIEFQATTARVPSVDVSPGVPGPQTNVVATVRVPVDEFLPEFFVRTFTGFDVVTVNQAITSLTTQASPSVLVGDTITDTATLSGGANPTGTITFDLFGPDDATCAGAPIFRSTVPVAGNGTYTSGPFTANAPGTYRWVATYSGDANNNPVATACNDPNEAVVVTAAPVPTIDVQKTAEPLSRPAPGGDFTFTVVVTNTSGQALTIASLNDDVYGDVTTRPGSTCNTAIGTVLAASPGPGNTYTCSFTGSFNGPAGASQTDVVTVVGTNAQGVTATDSDDATVTITAGVATPQLSTQLSDTSPVVGQSITDTATLSGGNNPTGTITFAVFTPDNPTCSGAPDITLLPPTPVNGNGTYTSPAIGFTQPGTHRFVATYSGDANNNPVTTACDDPLETAVVGPAGVQIVTNVSSAAVTVGQPVTDMATISTGFNPTGTVTFNLFGPDDATCARTPVFTSTVPVNGNGNYRSGPFTPTAPGVYRFTATYSGDANNAPATSPCNAPNENVTVTAPPVPTVDVQKTADPLTRPAPGGDFTYTVVVTNTSGQAVTITSMNDNIYGNLASRGSCTSAIGTVLAVSPGPGNTFTCAFTAPFTGPAGASLTDIVTVVVTDVHGQTATASDDATVTITASADLSLTKACDPGPVGPSAVFGCSVTVSNAGPSTAQNVSVTDELPAGVTLVGNPSGAGFTCVGADPFTCTLPSLAPNASATFTFAVRAENIAPGTPLVNRATVSSPTHDPNATDNTATATTSVISCTITGAGDIPGTEGDDVICGSAGRDRIAGLGGDDVIFGLAGDDQISGGAGNDVLSGGEGNDELAGGEGSDQLFGNGGGVDRLAGGGGDDYLNTVDGSGDDFSVGGDHVIGDTCVVDPGDSTALCEGSTSTTTLPTPTTAPTTTTSTTSTTSTVPPTGTTTTTSTAVPPTSTTTTTTSTTVPPVSTSTTSTTTTLPQATTTTSPPTTTTTTVGTGPLLCNGLVPTMVGTAGSDTILGTPGRDIIAGLGGSDRIIGGGGDDVICGGDGDDTLVGGDGNDDLFGGNGNDILDGGAGNDRLFGEAGTDTIGGRDGDDLLDGGTDSDFCGGGDGTDNATACELVQAVP